jgi:DNA mismatch endonuclease (patch repair protein)
MDVHDPQTRSYNMSRIRSKNTTPELLVRRFLHSHGFRFRIYDKKIPGKPDIVLRKYNTIIDVRGCFWHSHENCSKGAGIRTESTRVSANRLSAKRRDERNIEEWERQGWNIIVIWADCQLEPRKKQSETRNITLTRLLKQLRQIEDPSN